MRVSTEPSAPVSGPIGRRRSEAISRPGRRARTEPLALAILLDQLPRNMFRGAPQAFASDAQARKVAEAALAHDWDLAVTERERMFIYFPLGHSEDLADQDRALHLVTERMPQLGRMYLPHVQAHREVIRRFGRFPMRNAVLGRPTRPEE